MVTPPMREAVVKYRIHRAWERVDQMLLSPNAMHCRSSILRCLSSITQMDFCFLILFLQVSKFL